MALSRKHLETVCLIDDNTGCKCRYIGYSQTDNTKYLCAKLSPGRKSDIDAEIEETLKEYKANGEDPLKDGIPLGDHCKGYPALLHVEQGYDVDKKP
jgi:hypothetical protein